MKTYTKLTNLAASLSTNTSPTNVTLMGQLINDGHRYLLQKYFDNERTVTTTTVGGAKLTLTAPPSAGDTSATLSVSWIYPTVQQLVTFSDGEQIMAQFKNSSTALTWATPLKNSVTASISSVGVQSYTIPANVSKIKNDTINVGQLKYQPREIMSRTEWDTVNFLPYTSDIPNYYFIYNGTLSIFPIPSTTGNIITFNYKTRVSDLTYADYTTGTLAASGMVAGSINVVGTTTSWNTTFPVGVDLTYANLFISATPPGGDGIWYQIQSFTDATHLTLVSPVVNAPNISGASYVIGQLPLLQEDFQDTLVYYALKIYFSSIVRDAEKFKEFDSLYKERLELMGEYLGTKTASQIDLQDEVMQTNPNLFLYSPN